MKIWKASLLSDIDKIKKSPAQSIRNEELGIRNEDLEGELII